MTIVELYARVSSSKQAEANTIASQIEALTSSITVDGLTFAYSSYIGTQFALHQKNRTIKKLLHHLKWVRPFWNDRVFKCHLPNKCLLTLPFTYACIFRFACFTLINQNINQHIN